MFYNYAPLILMLFGTIIGLTGYYLDMVCSVGDRGWLWAGMVFILASGGVVSGGLIRKLSINSHTDFLTGLRNRRYFHSRLNREEVRAHKKKTSSCIAMVDVDDFKTINDTYGHAMGDTILSDLAFLLKMNTREADIVTRWGGDEFAIIFPETVLADASEIMERIRQRVEARFHSSYGLTISAGIAELGSDRDLQDALVKADRALYEAKIQKNSIITGTG